MNAMSRASLYLNAGSALSARATYYMRVPSAGGGRCTVATREYHVTSGISAEMGKTKGSDVFRPQIIGAADRV